MYPLASRYLAYLLLSSFLINCSSQKPEQDIELMSRLQASSELATVQMVFTKVVKGKKDNVILGIPMGYSEFLAETEAHVKAGIDLSMVRALEIDWQAGKIRLLLPPPKMISLTIPPESIRVNEEFTKDFYLSKYYGMLGSEDMDLFFRNAETELRAELKRMNLEDLVRKKTEAFLHNFLEKAGFVEVSFEYSSNGSDM